MRVVFDTNVFLSALFWGGKPKDSLSLVFEKKIVGVISDGILLELEEKLSGKFKYPKDQLESYLLLIVENFDFVKPKEKLNAVEDPDDNKILEAALEAKVKFVVTGDKHLLKLKEFKGIIIVTPKEFLKMILL